MIYFNPLNTPGALFFIAQVVFFPGVKSPLSDLSALDPKDFGDLVIFVATKSRDVNGEFVILGMTKSYITLQKV